MLMFCPDLLESGGWVASWERKLGQQFKMESLDDEGERTTSENKTDERNAT